ncbi:MAG: cobalamin-binding protein [Proteobacteria bacterium]|nr:MAG: cobalamin-binding protein [Pseudomonadota bacterium]
MQIIDPVTGDRVEVSGTSEQIEALKALSDLVEHGDVNNVPDATQRALDSGLEPLAILVNGLQAGLAVVGERFKRGTAFIPEVLVTARAMNAGFAVLKPLISPGSSKPRGTIVLGTVKGDLHDIGKGIVATMFEGAGFEVHDLGVNVTPEMFIEKVVAVNADIVGMSALLSTTMMMHKTTIEALREAGLRDKVKVICGGAPVTAKFAQEIGSDGWAPEAMSAVDVGKTLLSPSWDGEFVHGGTLKPKAATHSATV